MLWRVLAALAFLLFGSLPLLLVPFPLLELDAERLRQTALSQLLQLAKDLAILVSGHPLD